VLVLSASIDPSTVAALDPAEAALALRALPKRQRELATSRALARLALERLGAPVIPIVNDAERAPIWPAGVRGSITHCDTRALVAVCAAEHGSVGIDVEHRAGLKRSLWESVFLEPELAHLSSVADAEREALVLFSAKEALYKAQFPISRTYMGFRALHVAAAEGELVCTFQQDVPPFLCGAIARGRYVRDAPPTGEVLTGVFIPP